MNAIRHETKPPIGIESTTPSVMLVDDEADMRWVLKALLEDSGFAVTEAESGKAFREAMLNPPPDVALLDLKLPDASGLDLLQLIRQEWPHTEVIMLTGFGSVESALQAVKLGAHDYQQKPIDFKGLKVSIDRALECRRLRLDAEQHRRESLQGRKLLELLQESASAANDACRVADVAPLLLKRFCDYLGWPVGHLALFEVTAPGHRLRDSFWSHAPTRNYSAFQKVTDDGSINLRNDWAIQAQSDAGAHWSADVTREDGFARAHAAKVCGRKTALSAPIIVDQRLMGFLEFYAGSVAHPDARQRRAAAQLALQLGRVLERETIQSELAKTHQELTATIDRQTRQILELEENQERRTRADQRILNSLKLETQPLLNNLLSAARHLDDNLPSPASENLRADLRTICDKGTQLREIVDALHELASLNEPNAKARLTPAPTAKLCGAATREAVKLADNKQVTLQLDTSAAPELVVTDQPRLIRLLALLLDNAVKFTPPHGKVGLKASWNDARKAVTFVIWDSGVGIRKSDLRQIFEPFVRLDCSEGGDRPGPGLGLAVARQIVGLLDGAIDVESIPGTGSRFTLSLPRSRSES